MGQSAVVWAGRSRRRPSTQLDLPGRRRFDGFQLGLRGFEPARGDLSVRAGDSVGVVVGGGVALMLPSVRSAGVLRGDRACGWCHSPLWRGGGGLPLVLIRDLP